MSNDLKIKDINNKLDTKLSGSSWYELLRPYIQGLSHNAFMNKLFDDMGKGVRFQPAMKDWFNEFFEKDLVLVKAVVITFDYKPLPFELDAGTFRLVLNRTDSDDSSVQNEHGSYWKTFNELVLEFIIENTSHVPIIFINPMSYPIGKTIPAVSYKFFLPELTSPFWKEEDHFKLTLNNINKVIEKNGNSKLNW